jgi:predicted O-methyltransferase YrrM
VADRFFQLRAYFSYWLDAVDEHSLHSPFLFDFYTRVIKKKKQPAGVEKFEVLRQKLLNDKRFISTTDHGSGSSAAQQNIGAIAKTSLSPASLSELYAAIIRYFTAKQIVELGTCFGINTLYLAHEKDTQVVTFEGSGEIADIARLTFEFAQAGNIRLVAGNIDQTLPVFLQSVRKIDFVLMDANHRYQATLNYFSLLVDKIRETSVIVVDDIHYSKEMEQAWNQLKKHKLVYGSADLFRCGILFFDPSLNKQHVILHY